MRDYWDVFISYVELYGCWLSRNYPLPRSLRDVLKFAVYRVGAFSDLDTIQVQVISRIFRSLAEIHMGN